MLTKDGIKEDIWGMVNEICSYHFKADFVIVDSIYNSTEVQDFSKGHNVSKVTDELMKLKTKYKCTVFGIAHFNKGGDDQGLSLDRMSGASQLKNNLEFVSLMTTTSFDNFNLWTVGKIRGFFHDTEKGIFQFTEVHRSILVLTILVRSTEEA